MSSWEAEVVPFQPVWQAAPGPGAPRNRWLFTLGADSLRIRAWIGSSRRPHSEWTRSSAGRRARPERGRRPPAAWTFASGRGRSTRGTSHRQDERTGSATRSRVSAPSRRRTWAAPDIPSQVYRINASLPQPERPRSAARGPKTSHHPGCRPRVHCIARFCALSGDVINGMVFRAFR